CGFAESRTIAAAPSFRRNSLSSRTKLACRTMLKASDKRIPACGLALAAGLPLPSDDGPAADAGCSATALGRCPIQICGQPFSVNGLTCAGGPGNTIAFLSFPL